MKQLLIFLFVSLATLLQAQDTLSMSAVEGRTSLSMAAVEGRNSQGVYRYYAKGATIPFTGILYAKFPNGQYESYQAFVNGVGQGQWINYYQNGNYKEIGNYEQNRVEGPILKYHENGQLQSKGTYKDWRVRVGVWHFYDKEGNFLESHDYGEKGSLEEVKAYYERGEISKSWYEQILLDNGVSLKDQNK